jgi:tetratricopeptide (TPR) repeat protein
MKKRELLIFSGIATLTFVFAPPRAFAGHFDKLPLETAAYWKIIGGDPKYPEPDWKGKYMKKLSPGGKAYFLACRRDYKEALAVLETVPKRNTGSYYYVKAFCLEGLGRHAEAVRNFELAKSKIDQVFHPGFRFYLQCATAYMRVGNEKKALENLELAGPSSEEYGKHEAYPRFVRQEIEKRKVVAIEYTGNYKAAFDQYVSLFNQSTDQLRLNEPLAGDAGAKRRAADWLAKNYQAPASKLETDQAIYFLTKGKANLALGNIPDAKTALARACKVEPKERSPFLSERNKFEDSAVLLRIKDSAKVLLVRIYYKEKDYKKCCEYLRKLFSVEAMESLDTIYNTIAMRDLPQLVTQKDVELHDPANEFKLDKTDFVLYEPSEAQKSQEYDFRKDPQWKRALADIEKLKYGDCFKVLSVFILENSNPSMAATDYRSASRIGAFREHYSHVATLYQIGTGIAAGKPPHGLSILTQSSAAKSPQWTAIEDVLLGRKRRALEKRTTDFMCDEGFEQYCRFAAATRSMQRGEYKLALKEFDQLKRHDHCNKHLLIYAAALKHYCLNKR